MALCNRELHARNDDDYKELYDDYGDCVRVVYSLNSESWMVKNGRKSRLNLSGDIILTRA